MKPWYATSSDKPHGSPQGGNNKFTLAGDVVYKLSAPTSSARPLNGTETWDMKDVQLICAEKVDKVPVLNMDAFIAYGARTEKVHETIASTSSVQDDSESESAAGSSTSSVQDNSGSGSGSDEDDPGSDDDDSSDDGSSFSVGTEVVLTTDFGDHSDASGGSLEPGA